MDFTINGGYAPYIYIVLLKVSLFFLQRMNHLRQRSTQRGASVTANVLIDFYCVVTAFTASILSWATWALAVFVGYKFGIPAGILFFAAGFFGSMLLPIIVPSGFLYDLIGHIVSLFATPYLVVLIVRSINIL